MRQMNKKPMQAVYSNPQLPAQPSQQKYQQQQQQNNQRGRGGRRRGGRGRGRGQNNIQVPKQESNANMAQQLAEVTAHLNALREQAKNNNNNDGAAPPPQH